MNASVLLRKAATVAGGVAIALGFATPAFAVNMNPQWNLAAPMSFCANDGGGSCDFGKWFLLNNVTASVTYHVSVVNVDTGGAVACGASLPEGTKVKYVFKTHLTNDASWNGTGFGYDTPFGHWVAGAGSPPTAICGPSFALAPENGLNEYASFSVNPPTKSLTQLPGTCTVLTDGVSQQCVLGTPKKYNTTFNFSGTNGSFYTAGIGTGHRSCSPATGGKPMATYIQGSMTTMVPQNSFTRNGGGNVIGTPACGTKGCQVTVDTYTPTSAFPARIPIAAQSVVCPITVTKKTGVAPGAPSISASTAACTVNSPYSITLSATDADNDTIRYGIDWDANGTVDQYAPPPVGAVAQFVPSGTAQTASRIFATAGRKQIQVLTEDSTGLKSTWASFSFTCNASSKTTAPVGVGAGAGAGAGSDTNNNGNVNVNTGNNDTGAFTGNGANSGGLGGGLVGGTLPDLVISANPSLLARGAKSKISWKAQNVASCKVFGSNGDTLGSSLESLPGGGNETAPITQHTVYTLTCLDSAGKTLAKNAEISILPKFSER